MASPMTSTASPPAASLRTSLKGISRAVSWVTALGLILAFGGVIYFLAMPKTVAALLGLGEASHVANAAAAQGVRLRLLFALLPGLVLFTVTMVQIRALFRRFSLGVILDFANAHRLSRIGWLIITGGIISVLQRSFVSLALTLGNPAGQKQFVVSFAVTDIVIVLFGLFVLAFAHVIGEGARLADENRGFV